ncbi:hypothetical protein PFICI_01808 [Pestalotiopsis fici W106-1]|uniref:Uncharacterized protein n=1 Tax=Pestalotiopsis fici (strain W106-1 / CGMCC3.15140) TaxID=1229662 RepID=W3XPT5_PESFW|nr:uncharacterized protein PFICI_01808 [Pestalotiopsis fici W106-1]ETS87980.1 hypothetical protein PFICI_01808 [Pestalotiopsis fici W106-1]
MERIYGNHEAQKQSNRPMQQQQSRRPPPRNGQNHFPPPSAVPSYASRNLPPLPPKSASSSSSVYNSEGSCRATPSRFHRHESPLFMYSGSRAGSGGSGGADAGFEGSVNEDGMAMIRPPGMSIVTHFSERQQQKQDTVIHSPRPRHPDHKIVKDLEQNDEGCVDVSPILSPPTGTFSYQAHEVSPLTPEDSSSFRSFGQQTVSELDHEADQYQRWTTMGGGGVDSGSRRQSGWEDIPPAASHSSLGFHPISTEEDKTKKMISKTSKPHHGHYQPHFRHSDPGSPLVETSSSPPTTNATGGGQGAFMLAAPKPYLKTSAWRPDQYPRPRSENNYTKPTTTRAPVVNTKMPMTESTDGEDIITSPYSLWTKGYGATAAAAAAASSKQSSPAPSGTSSRVSFAIKDTPAFSKRSRAGSKPKPVPLHLHDGKAAEDHIKTPYPEQPLASAAAAAAAASTTMISSWDYDDDDNGHAAKDKQPKRTSWGRSSERNSGAKETSEGGSSSNNTGSSRSRAMGKLVSRVKHAGGDVISKFSFSSEEAKREKRIEELRGKIQHHNPRQEQQNRS